MYKCEVCGKEFERQQYGYDFKNICGSECFDKKFWLDIIKEKEYHPVIKGRCYYCNIDKPISHDELFLGNEGRHLTIKFFDGRIIETNNLWCNGDVPEWCRNELPDNAEFME